ncbi:MAG: hypothetical protein COW55_13915 [Rhodobacteraceae bacterium CG17_big_fil_post_rev_8_21_14_2_50_65_11]|nr:MAG: hypothetical protein COW55_13915 [Rhodobacteraceae bacterium CG17_big_fil_post_rev_8_21_14_2_50_65_11]
MPIDFSVRPLGDPMHHFWLAQSMAKATGVDLVGAMQGGRIAQQDWADMITHCRGCAWAEGCAHWLDAQESGMADVPSDCVNAAVFTGLKT